MSKTGLIIKREYLSRVRKKSFVIMTILGPILMAALMIVPAWMAMQDKDIQVIQVVDETFVFEDVLPNSSTVTFKFDYEDLQEAKNDLYEENFTSVLYIPYNAHRSPHGLQLFYEDQPGFSTIQYINSQLSEIIKDDRLLSKYGIEKNELSSIKPNVDVLTIKVKESGEEEKSYAKISYAVGIFAAILIYFFIFLYGVQVMRGVIEEKTSRIVEVIISSVKPFQLMLGKITGIALVGLTQFLLWIILTGVLVGGAQMAFSDELEMLNQNQNDMGQFIPEAQKEDLPSSAKLIENVKETLSTINFTVMLWSFLFYFLGGYLLYGALFAAVGSAVDSEADTQQFMLPITIPLIFSFVVAQMILQNPDSSLAFWMSIIPFTSPVVMMVRIPFGVEYWELWLSMGMLALGFFFTTWVAARIYRTGILMYGKKVNYKELWKWLRFKH